MENSGVIALIGLGLMLGARHAVDFDHIAAVNDFMGGEKDFKKGFKLSLFYIAGHDSVNILVGMIAILLGKSLPHWVDGIMEKIVGFSLLFLGAWLCLNLFRNRDEDVVISRWRLLFIKLHKIYHRFLNWVFKKTNQEQALERELNIGYKTAYLIGVLHGFGGETASQILIYATVAGAGTILMGITSVISFILGLFVAQVVIITLISTGYTKMANSRKLYRNVAFISSFYSVVLGASILLR